MAVENGRAILAEKQAMAGDSQELRGIAR